MVIAFYSRSALYVEEFGENNLTAGVMPEAPSRLLDRDSGWLSDIIFHHPAGMIGPFGSGQAGESRIIHGIDESIVTEFAAKLPKEILRETVNRSIGDFQQNTEDFTGAGKPESIPSDASVDPQDPPCESEFPVFIQDDAVGFGGIPQHQTGNLLVRSLPG